MRRVFCPECDTKVKVPEDCERSFIRCTSCGEKIPLNGAAPKTAEPAKSSLPGCLALMAYGATLLAALGCVAVAFLSPGVAMLLGILLGIAVAALAGIIGLVFWVRAAARNESKFRALAPWLGLQVIGAVILFSPIALHGIAKKAGWLAPAEGGEELAKGPPGGNPPDKEAPEKKEVKDPPKKEKDLPKKEKDPPKKEKDLPKKEKDPPKEDKAPLKMTGDAALDKLLTDLADQEGKAFKPAIDRLTAMAPNEHQAVVAQHLSAQLKISPVYNRTSLLRALAKWGTPAEVPVLIEMLANPDINTRNETLQALGKLKDERAAEAMARCLVEIGTRDNAVQALKAMGPIAETEVLGILKEKDTQVKLAAIRVLAEIGTQQSVPELEAVVKGPLALRNPAQQALKAIAARSQK